MFPYLFAIEGVADQTVTAEENIQPLAVARGSGCRRTADAVRLFNVRGCDGASPERLPSLLVEGDRGQFLRPDPVTSQKDSASAQDRRGVSGIQQHPPMQLAGRSKVVRQRSGA